MKLCKLLIGVFAAAIVAILAIMCFAPALVRWRVDILNGLPVVYREPVVQTLVFYIVAGLLAALTLGCGLRVLLNISCGEIFVAKNATACHVAAVAVFSIGGAAFVRMLLRMADYADAAAVLLEYNTLVAPAAAVAGLMLLLFGQIFAQSAQLKQDNDLVI